jgi:hypothetical protein
MANEEQLAILRQGVEVWNEWRKANAHAEIDQRVHALSRSTTLRG